MSRYYTSVIEAHLIPALICTSRLRILMSSCCTTIIDSYLILGLLCILGLRILVLINYTTTNTYNPWSDTPFEVVRLDVYL